MESDQAQESDQAMESVKRRRAMERWRASSDGERSIGAILGGRMTELLIMSMNDKWTVPLLSTGIADRGG